MQPRPLLRNILVNFAGQGLPLLAAAVSLPMLASALGIERLGLMTLAWVVLGAFGLLDFGLGRALTQMVSTRLALGEHASLRGLLGAGCGLLFAGGVIAGTVIGATASWSVIHAFSISADLHDEARRAVYLLAVGVPFMMASSAARGFLEAHQRFGLVNAVKAPLGVLIYAGPLLVVRASSPSVAGAVAVIAGARIAACAAYMAMAWSLLPAGNGRLINRRDTSELLRGGLWITSSNVVAALFAYADRFMLGAITSVEALAYYATPQELIGRVSVIPTTFGAVVFPAFSAASVQQGDTLMRLFEKASRYSHLLLFPATFAAAAFAPEWLSLWMGPSFAVQSRELAQWFCLGMFLNGLAITPFGFLQALGRADLTAKVQFCELPFYLVGFWTASARYGAAGAAVVWAARMGIDLVALCLGSVLIAPSIMSALRRSGRDLGIATAGFLLVTLAPELTLRFWIFAILSVWFLRSLPRLVEREDREALASMLSAAIPFRRAR